MKYRDYYEILGVGKTASQAEIKKAFRNLAKKHHPDANPNNKKSEELFKEFSEAYEVLGDPDKRKKYDALAEEAKFQNGRDFDPSQTQRGKAGYSPRSSPDNDFSDFFNMFFGGDPDSLSDLFGRDTNKSRRTRHFAQDGEDIEAEISIPLKEAYHGIEKKVNLRDSASGKTISFKIPSGILSGQRIKLAGQGNPGMEGGRNGNLIIKVIVLEDNHFLLNGLDLETPLDLLPWEAGLGCEAKVETLDGKILVQVPEGIQTDGKIRIAGKGYRDAQGRRGDLYLRIRMMNPKTMGGSLKEFYRKMANKEKI